MKPKTKKYTIEEFLKSEKLKQLIQPCDIVLTKSPSRAY